MNYNSLKDIFAQQEGAFFYVQENFWLFIALLAFTFFILVIGTILAYAIYEYSGSKLVLSIMVLFSFGMSILAFTSLLNDYNHIAKISEVKTVALENIESKLKMDNISELNLKVSENEVVTATAKYTNMTERTTADLTIGFEDSGEPFILTSKIVTPEFIKTIEK